MSEDHLKKLAKNAKTLLPELLEKHHPPFSLAECQEFVARLSGYPSWHIASAALSNKPVLDDDPLALFYRYDWHKATLGPNIGLGDPEKCKVSVHHVLAQDAIEFIKEKCRSSRPIDHDLLVINAAGDDGGKIIDQLFDEGDLTRQAGALSLSTLSHRIGTTINPFAGLTSKKVAEVLTSIVSAVSSDAQRECCYKALDLLISGTPQNEIDLPTIQSAVDKLICLANGGWSKNDEDFYETFPDTERHEEAHAFMERYFGSIPGLLRPLDALLTRLAVPGLAKAFSPRLCEADRESRDEFLSVDDGLWDGFFGITIVNLDLGNEVLDHLAALLVMVKVFHASQFKSAHGFNGELAQIDVVWMRTSLAPLHFHLVA